MMFMAVDLPEPEGPNDGDEFAARDGKIDAGQRVDAGLAMAVGLPDVPRKDRSGMSAIMFIGAGLTAGPGR